MTRLVWDKLDERGFETGVDHGVLYLQEDGQYPKGEVWNGLTGVTESPSGAEPTAMWADNIKYVNLLSAEEFAATVEAFYYPDGFKKCNGELEVAKGMRIGQQTRQPFGLSYRTWNGNAEKGQRANYTIHIIYNATASPSERAYATESDSPELTAMSWELSTTPMNIEGFNPTAYVAIESATANAEKLKQLENILYGSASSEARLPLPDELIEILGAVEGSFNPSFTLTPVTGETDLLGKQASELQTGIEVGTGSISGTLNYITGYTGYHGSDPEQQEGNYLALKFENEPKADKIEVLLSNGPKGKTPLDEDGLCVFRVTNPAQSIAVFATKGEDTEVRYYSLNGLTLKPKSE